MKKYILGINAIGINTSACLILNNKIICAVEEERLTKKKRTKEFPINAINFCLNKYNISFEQLNSIAISWNPLINLEKFSSSFTSNLLYLPSVLHSSINYFIQELKNKHENNYFTQSISLKNNKKINIYYVNHHLSHASHFFISGFKNASILTVDGFGENQCIGYYKGNNDKIIKIWEQNFPHSLGSFFSTFTEYCGFLPESEEWKLMGAAAYGDSSRFVNLILNLIKFKKDGGFDLELKYFNHYLFHRPKYFSNLLSNYLKIKPNTRKKLSKEYFNLAYASQYVFEKIYLHLINGLYKKNKNNNLVVSGGVALNCLANGKILLNSNFKKLFISPFPDDNGASIGAALYVSNVILNSKNFNYKLSNNYFGPNFSSGQIENKLKKYNLNYTKPNNIYDDATDEIINGKIIAWFQGSLEFGDRALGNRSILADPRRPQIKELINSKIKYREEFRPFAPSILEEKVDDYFESNQSSFFMERALKFKENKKKLIPGVVHLDGTGRLQTVSLKNNKIFYNLINTFYKKTNIPILLNTSFNINKEPMVCNVEDAIKNFYLSGLDIVYIGNFKIKK